jgi:hypothetical protein
MDQRRGGETGALRCATAVPATIAASYTARENRRRTDRGRQIAEIPCSHHPDRVSINFYSLDCGGR